MSSLPVCLSSPSVYHFVVFHLCCLVVLGVFPPEGERWRRSTRGRASRAAVGSNECRDVQICPVPPEPPSQQNVQGTSKRGAYQVGPVQISPSVASAFDKPGCRTTRSDIGLNAGRWWKNKYTTSCSQRIQLSWSLLATICPPLPSSLNKGVRVMVICAGWQRRRFFFFFCVFFLRCP